MRKRTHFGPALVPTLKPGHAVIWLLFFFYPAQSGLPTPFQPGCNYFLLRRSLCLNFSVPPGPAGRYPCLPWISASFCLHRTGWPLSPLSQPPHPRTVYPSVGFPARLLPGPSHRSDSLKCQSLKKINIKYFPNRGYT